MAKNKYGTNFLDFDRLYKEYQPIINATYAKFSKWGNIYHSPTDYEDLKAQVDLEFMRLCQEYDPSRGVDFAGYVYFHLNQRVYHQVTKFQKRVNNETTSPTKADNEEEASIDFDGIHDPVDYENDRELQRSEALSSIEWDVIGGENYKPIVELILLSRKTMEETAEILDLPVKTVAARLATACDKLRQWSIYQDEFQSWRVENPKHSFEDFVAYKKTNRKPILDIRNTIVFKKRYYKRSQAWKAVQEKPVVQFYPDGKYVKQWPSLQEAGRHGYDPARISKVAQGKQNSHKGYIWRYKDGD